MAGETHALDVDAGPARDPWDTDVAVVHQRGAATMVKENLLLAATSLGLGAVWLGILYLIKGEVLDFLQEPGGEFMAVVPVGHPLRATQGPNKKPLENVIKKI